ncbi:MAG: hypothetical protein JSR55_07430 [Proteobacteria bacterium]|nr:hypothetical protein [Pseudomonadota bacterium]
MKVLNFLRLRHFQLSGCSWTFPEDFADPRKISVLNDICLSVSAKSTRDGWQRKKNFNSLEDILRVSRASKRSTDISDQKFQYPLSGKLSDAKVIFQNAIARRLLRVSPKSS